MTMIEAACPPRKGGVLAEINIEKYPFVDIVRRSE